MTNTILASNSTISSSTDIPDPKLDPKLGKGKLFNLSLTTWLRWLGAGALLTSAVVFMLQGVNDISAELRNWLYLISMTTMSGLAVGCKKYMRDLTGARLFLALAVCLIPVQFSQLGGMLYDFSLNPTTGGINPSTLAWVGACTLGLYLPISFTAFSILARPSARTLTLVFFLLNCLLLIPARESIGAVIVIATLLGTTLITDRSIFRQQVIFNNLSGLGLRFLCLTPLLICTFRFALHLDDIVGFACIGALICVIAADANTESVNPIDEVPEHRNSNNLLLVVSAIVGGLCWPVLALAAAQNVAQQPLYGTVILNCTLIPMSIWLLHIAKLATPAGRIWQQLAVVSIAVCAYGLVMFGLSGGADLLAFGYGLGLLLLGVLQTQKGPTLGGVVILVFCSIMVIAEAFSQLHLNIWVTLGVAGIGLVTASSVAERFGHRWLAKSRGLWTEFSGWS